MDEPMTITVWHEGANEVHTLTGVSEGQAVTEYVRNYYGQRGHGFGHWADRMSNDGWVVRAADGSFVDVITRWFGVTPD